MSAITLLLCLSLPHAAQTDWHQYSVMALSGTEQVFGGRVRKWSVTREQNNIHVVTERGIGPALTDKKRHEISGDLGVFTWLDSQPKWVLQLTAPSVPEYLNFAKPAPFAKDALTSGKTTIEKATGKTVVESGKSTIAGRSAYYLALGDKSEPGWSQKQWFDQETGASLRRTETSLGQTDYQMEVQSLSTQPGSKPTVQPPASATVIKGLVHPDLLLHADETHDQKEYESDITAVRAKSLIESGRWIKFLPKNPGLEYVHTVATATRPNGSKKGQQSAGSPNGTITFTNQDGSITTINSASGAGATIVFAAPTGGQAIVPSPPGGVVTRDISIRLASPSGSGNVVQGQPFTVTLDTATIVGSLNGISSNSAAPGSPQAAQKRNALIKQGLGGEVQTDYLDKATGDTLSLIQYAGITTPTVLRNQALRKKNTVTSNRLGSVDVYEASAPLTIKAVAWKTELGTSVLTGTRISVEELLKLVETLR